MEGVESVLLYYKVSHCMKSGLCDLTAHALQIKYLPVCMPHAILAVLLKPQACFVQYIDLLGQQEKVHSWYLSICSEQQLVGRIRVARDGVNVTVS